MAWHKFFLQTGIRYPSYSLVIFPFHSNIQRRKFSHVFMKQYFIALNPQ